MSLEKNIGIDFKTKPAALEHICTCKGNGGHLCQTCEKKHELKKAEKSPPSEEKKDAKK